MRVLLVEDHAGMRTMITDHLADRGIVVDGYGRAEDGLAAGRSCQYDAMILDLGLPDMDGLDLLCRLREAVVPAPPALILTARDAVQDRVRGLDAGADDYIVKPFALAELDARLRAIMRRPGSRLPPVHRLGNLAFDPASREATVTAADGKTARMELTRLEATLLEVLIRAAPAIVVKDALDERIYGFGERASVNALEAVISRLRRKLAAAAASATVQSVRGIGCRLCDLPGGDA